MNGFMVMVALIKAKLVTAGGVKNQTLLKWFAVIKS